MGMVTAQNSQLETELLGELYTRSYGRVWKQNIADEEVARLAVVGIGPLGARTVQKLSKTQCDLSCHEIWFNKRSGRLAEMETVLAAVRTCDFLFIVSGFDDPLCEVVFRQVAGSVRDTEVPILGVVPDNQGKASLLPFVTSLWPVSYRSLGGDLASVTPSLESRDEGTEYALTHLVATLTNILTHKGLIGIDYDNVVDTLKSGAIGRLAVGVASEQVSIAGATLIVQGLLADQGSDISSASGVIAYLAGADTLLTMDKFDTTSQILYDKVGEEIGVIVGIQLVETSRPSVTVTIMALSTTYSDYLL
ncbi:hypothetical protein GMLC_17970 [Geomonas limicola]|uniref:Tubulin/FtsZ GTPase domain-containing protein n=1 Tax=Geomonas limicola TaxID=2740186 RepID=A0A6V8N6L3_9BACT|nr:hypothetical protein [Geomonas limicola]GFO68218.1 hypothetical protein GMLC_17970 [Geomonas limicola]